MMNNHSNEQPDFKFSLDKSWKTSLLRQLREAMLIDATPPDELMNSKSEFGSNSVPRVVIEQDNNSSSMNNNNDNSSSMNNNNRFKRVQYERLNNEMNNSKRRKTTSNGSEKVFSRLSKIQVNATPPSFSQSISKFCTRNASKRKTTDENAPRNGDAPENAPKNAPENAPENASGAESSENAPNRIMTLRSVTDLSQESTQ